MAQVKPGDPLQIPAQDWNDLLDMLDKYRSGALGRGTSGGGGRGRSLVLASEADQFADSLINKLEAGTGIEIEVKPDTAGENERVTIVATGETTPGSYTFDDEWIQNNGNDEIQHIGPSTEDAAHSIITGADEDPLNAGRLRIKFKPLSVDARGHVRQLNTETSTSVDLTAFGLGGGGTAYIFWLDVHPDSDQTPVLLDDDDWRGYGLIGSHIRYLSSGVDVTPQHVLDGKIGATSLLGTHITGINNNWVKFGTSSDDEMLVHDGFGLPVKVYVDRNDGGKLKARKIGTPSNRGQLFLTVVRSTAKLTAPTHTLSA